MFEWLFKYPLGDYNAGSLTFTSGWPLWLLLCAIALVAAVLALSLWFQRRRLSGAKLATLWFLQSAVAATLLTMLWQPALEVKNLKAGENTVAVLLDHSASMDYDNEGATRRAHALETIDTISAPLQSNYQLKFGNVGTELTWVEDINAEVPATTQSNIAGALLDALEQAKSEPVAAVVLTTDGSDNSGLVEALEQPDFWQQLQQSNIPVHTIGIGREVLAEDTEIVAVSLPDSTLPGTVERASITLRHGNAETARIKVYDGDSIIAIEEKPLPGTPGEVTFDVDIDAAESGLRELRFEVEPGLTDKVPENNSRRRLLQVGEQQRKVLYFEGEPRWEYKFIRRAVEEAEGLSLVTILRTTTNKFYRQGITSPEQHANGFPITKEALYAYDALIIGNVEAISLSASQHQLIHDYVAERGGTLLMMAGRNALADGGWYNSPVAKALPVTLPQSNTATFERIRAKALLTQSGALSPITRLHDDAQQNSALWLELPELADFQRTGPPKPGARTLLGVELPDGSYPLLTQQRYGRGNSFVLASGGTWRWQMQLPSEDLRHEQFWQQLLQTMSNSATQRFEVTTDRQIYLDDAQVTINAKLLNPEFTPALNSQVSAELTAPDGTSQTIALQASAGTAGEFSATVDAVITGSWRVDVSVDGDNQNGTQETADQTVTNTTDEPEITPAINTETRWVHREDGLAENFNLGLNSAFLKRIADTTGGNYWTPDSADALPDAIRADRSGIVRLQTLPLWNIPLFFVLLLGLKLVEWLLRMAWGRL